MSGRRRSHDQAGEVLGVAAIVAVHGASVPWGLLEASDVIIVPARRVPHLLRGLPAMLGPERVAWPTEPGCGSTPPPDSRPACASPSPAGTNGRSG